MPFKLLGLLNLDETKETLFGAPHNEKVVQNELKMCKTKGLGIAEDWAFKEADSMATLKAKLSRCHGGAKIVNKLTDFDDRLATAPIAGAKKHAVPSITASAPEVQSEATSSSALVHAPAPATAPAHAMPPAPTSTPTLTTAPRPTPTTKTATTTDTTTTTAPATTTATALATTPATASPLCQKRPNAATAVVEPTNGGPSKKKKEEEKKKEEKKENENEKNKKRRAQDDTQEDDTSNPYTKTFKARVLRAPRERT